MIKNFIFAKLAEKFFKKAMQGDRRGLMKYFKIALVAFIVFVVLVIIGIFFLLQFIFGLFTHVGNQAELVKNVNELKIEESIKKAKEMIPEELSTTVEQVKTKITPYDNLAKEVGNVMLKVTEIVERFEKLIP